METENSRPQRCFSKFLLNHINNAFEKGRAISILFLSKLEIYLIQGSKSFNETSSNISIALNFIEIKKRYEFPKALNKLFLQYSIHFNDSMFFIGKERSSMSANIIETFCLGFYDNITKHGPSNSNLWDIPTLSQWIQE